MVKPWRALALALILAAPATAGDDAPEIARALGRAPLPWYDPAKDRVKPVPLPAPPKEWNWNWGAGGGGLAWVLGNAVALLGFGLGLMALLLLLAWFWRIYEPTGASTETEGGPGEPERVEALPAGLRREFASSDAWSEALRRRERGDLSGAVVCLFAHQLLSLSRLGLVRLAPGKTGRQLLRSVGLAEFRSLADPTLRLFEAVYYGHRVPSPGEFERVWEQAEAFERRAARGVAV